jgi:Tfp pilus assembly protein PilN
MSPRYQLNLAAQPFRSYRGANLVLAVILVLIVGFTLWQASQFSAYTEDLEQLRVQEQAARVQWQFLGTRVEELRSRLGRSDTIEAIDEIRFLNEIVERKQFSWTLLLREIERTIPRTVYIVSLTPQISDRGFVRVRMEARGESVDALTLFLTNLGDNSAFDNVTVSVEEVGEVDGRMERRLLMEVDYTPSNRSTIDEVAAQ